MKGNLKWEQNFEQCIWLSTELNATQEYPSKLQYSKAVTNNLMNGWGLEMDLEEKRRDKKSGGEVCGWTLQNRQRMVDYCTPGECSSKDTVQSWECTVQAYNYRECNYPWVPATALWNSSLYLDCSQQVTKSGRNTKAHMSLLWQLTFAWGLSDGFAELKLTEESLNNCEDTMMYFIAISLSPAILTIAQQAPVKSGHVGKDRGLLPGSSTWTSPHQDWPTECLTC